MTEQEDDFMYTQVRRVWGEQVSFDSYKGSGGIAFELHAPTNQEHVDWAEEAFRKVGMDLTWTSAYSFVVRMA